MFTPEDRESIVAGLVEAARTDPDVVAAAIVGSGARGTLDRWSDIDLALRLAPEAHEPSVVERWTERIRERHGLADALDVMAQARYRVFLLPSSLQIDLSFWPADRFRATGEGFRLVFGEAGTPTENALPDGGRAIGTGWLFALHARSAIRRGRNRQAVLMLDGLRDQVVTLGCLRHGLNPWHGRGVDRLPPTELAALDHARAATADTAEITRSLRAFLELLLAEAEAHDPARADRLRPVFRELSG